MVPEMKIMREKFKNRFCCELQCELEIFGERCIGKVIWMRGGRWFNSSNGRVQTSAANCDI